jgi:hypothetical protein
MLAIGTGSGLVAIGAAATAIALTPKTGSYSGPTSQAGQVIDFTVSKVGAGHDVTLLEMNQVLVDCTGSSGTQHITAPLNKGGDFPIKNGKFKFKGPITINNGTTPIARGKGKIVGTFSSSKKVAGSAQFSWHFNNHAPGSLAGSNCNSGPLTYTAKHK